MPEPVASAQSVQITQLLQAIGQESGASGGASGKASGEASARLISTVYDELRAMARQRLRSERADHTLQTTALVHEAYLKLLGGSGSALTWQHRAHFFGACANAMRQILVEHARARNARKRGGGIAPDALGDDEHAGTSSENLDLILAVNDSLEQLRSEDARAAQVVELRFFGGLEMSEIAEALQVSDRSVHRDWAFARVRLLQMFDENE